ncbi:hypothetical protein COLO4_21465 [Corchorus olitorius]|uniref:Uncharacterized protein n=1 Tax=Corchorus olitorius TaxID=93759 RepID=A0A1R3IT17_9ROSI|nr:hypothetical protein COLO4_21465 [Corchorus olitorius]
MRGAMTLWRIGESSFKRERFKAFDELSWPDDEVAKILS